MPHVCGRESVTNCSPSQVEIIFKPHACLAPDVASRLGEAGTRFIKTKVISLAATDHGWVLIKTRGMLSRPLLRSSSFLTLTWLGLFVCYIIICDRWRQALTTWANTWSSDLDRILALCRTILMAMRFSSFFGFFVLCITYIDLCP